MGVNIVVDNIKTGEDLKILNNANISSRTDSNVEVHNLLVKGNAIILNSLNLEDVKEDLNEKLVMMDKNIREYEELKKLLESYGKGENKFKKKLLEHLQSFAEGIAASVVANYISTMF